MSNLTEKWRAVWAKLKQSRQFRFVAIGLLIFTVLAVYYVSAFGGRKNAPNQDEGGAASAAQSYSEEMHARLGAALAALRGVGKVEVIIRFESTPELVIAYITSISQNGSTTSSPQILTQQGSQLPLVLKTVYPKALGVLVVAEGAQNTAVKIDILRAVTALLDVDPGVVNVFPM